MGHRSAQGTLYPYSLLVMLFFFLFLSLAHTCRSSPLANPQFHIPLFHLLSLLVFRSPTQILPTKSDTCATAKRAWPLYGRTAKPR